MGSLEPMGKRPCTESIDHIANASTDELDDILKYIDTKIILAVL